ncbi:SIMPL domain-containing protein [Ferrimonas senticii]|uniref:SIMPL domain-containing protein n=1 Tax=Ferrimonas senticii TaxID=394566 RepID=UPI000414AD00|nr:SIMPL domain-containing protein [Ferrimonas senticii]
MVNERSAVYLGLSLFFGLALLGMQLADAALDYRQLERRVTVKGLAEQEVMADVVIWPIQFSAADDDLGQLYQTLEQQAEQISAFLLLNGISETEISKAPPAITDRSAQQYGSREPNQLRFAALQTVTVYSNQIESVRAVMNKLAELGKQGIVFTGGDYQAQTEYLFTGLNSLKPTMVEEATRNARDVAERFAKDSASRLGKIRCATQGQFSISSRDNNNPHIKKVRVVSTVEYYLSD